MSAALVSTVVLVSAVVTPPLPLPADAAGQGPCAPKSFLDNGVIRVGVDPDAGGAIDWLGPSGSDENVVNTFDLGRYVQQSYYSGPTPFVPPGSTPHPFWPAWPWNPIQAGDSFGNSAPLTALANDGTTLYVEAIPYQWGLDGVPGEATVESWISLEPSAPNVVRVHNVLRNHRTDGVEQHPARDQELPAVYTNEPYVRVFTYTGDTPFSGGPVEEIDTTIDPGVTFPWKAWRTTEGWSALLDDDLRGLGVVHPGVVSTIGGRAGVDVPGPFNTGYLAPLHQEIIDHDITYAYDYSLVLGHLDDIRAYAEAQRVDPRPEYVFAHDRRHVTYRGATDTGFPIDGFLDVRATSTDPQILGPAAAWDAAEVPRLFVRAGFDTADDQAQLYFADGSGHFDDSRRITFDVIGDGEVRAYEIDLAAHPLYSGTIGGIRIDPAASPTDGDRVRLQWISYRDDPDEPEAPSTPAVPVQGDCGAESPPATTGPLSATPSTSTPAAAPPRFTG